MNTDKGMTNIRDLREELDKIAIDRNELELDPNLIDPSPFSDRLPDDLDSNFEQLRDSIRDHGQKVPILVRPHLAAIGRYQIIYGHRRWRAGSELGRKVVAIKRELNDAELAVAQGLENSVRQDLTWIERALFASRMDSCSVRTSEIRGALSIDDPELARMRKVCASIPAEVVRAIGRAPKAGRPRWVELAKTLAGRKRLLARVRETLSGDKVSALPSDERFARVLAVVKSGPNIEMDHMELMSEGGVVGLALFSPRQVTLKVGKAEAAAFSEFLREELPSLVERFLKRDRRT
jgi:ParB family chromosome partitioning protein